MWEHRRGCNDSSLSGNHREDRGIPVMQTTPIASTPTVIPIIVATYEPIASHITAGVNEGQAMPAESSISDDLRKAFLQFGAPLAWQSVILDVVRKYHPDIPKDPRTILHTPRSCRQKCIGDGVYIHFGLEWALHRQLRSVSADCRRIFSL
ncbi:hypothetical protein EG68_11404 [Paragonimus skrjabini miyazakii]|uniref:Uncharacterized protein n=1 Tax=Paragonimus skrjabini miyazakii TaxID=59628 RepID=A0A8S9YGG6_9TREM|nr:hypothetical protein EG68_11404 [Paragonimus skrjabini miyazakii]